MNKYLEKAAALLESNKAKKIAGGIAAGAAITAGYLHRKKRKKKNSELQVKDEAARKAAGKNY